MIGGGASGLTAAVCAARQAEQIGVKAGITVWEANPRVGKKILVTGNGRCNMTNTDTSVSHYRGETDLVQTILNAFGAAETLELFSSLGLYTRTDFAGRIYPASNQAASLLDCLRDALIRYGVTERTDSKVTDIRKKDNGFLVNGSLFFDRVILATGGKAAPVHGSDGSGFALLDRFGVGHTPLYPALVPLNIANFTHSLKGIRAEGSLTLSSRGRTLAFSQGEIQFADYGISGIPAMQISRFAAEKLAAGEEVTVTVDCAPAFSEEELKNALLAAREAFPDRSVESVLSGVLPKRLGTALITSCSLVPSKRIGAIYDNAAAKLAAAVKKSKYTVSSVRGFADAQVTAGGIPAEEIVPETMMLKKAEGLFVCGEIVNVDGECGGYNLQWAFSSGAVAGKSAIGE